MLRNETFQLTVTTLNQLIITGLINTFLFKIFLEKCTYGFPKGENGSAKSQLATSVAVDSKSVCAGLSRAFKYVFDLLKTESIVVNGDTIKNIVPKSGKDEINENNS